MEENNTNIIVLQLGNFEFHPSLKFNIMDSKLSPMKNSGSESSKTFKISEFYEGRNWLFRSLLDFSKLILTPYYLINIQNKYQIYFEILRNIIIKNNKKLFVVISPLPCYKTANNIIRKKGVKYFENFIDLENVIFVNSHEVIPISKDLFANQNHLSVMGHKLLGEEVSKMISEYYKS